MTDEKREKYRVTKCLWAKNNPEKVKAARARAAAKLKASKTPGETVCSICGREFKTARGAGLHKMQAHDDPSARVKAAPVIAPHVLAKMEEDMKNFYELNAQMRANRARRLSGGVVF